MPIYWNDVKNKCISNREDYWEFVRYFEIFKKWLDSSWRNQSLVEKKDEKIIHIDAVAVYISTRKQITINHKHMIHSINNTNINLP